MIIIELVKRKEGIVISMIKQVCCDQLVEIKIFPIVSLEFFIDINLPIEL